MEKKTIGSFMAALRKSNGMTQQEVAERLNVSNKTVSKWERDESHPEITLIPVIAELFEVTSDEILKGERISKFDSGEKAHGKVEKQIKRIVTSSILRFKNVSLISLSLVIVGLILLFTISYAKYEPVIAFGVFLFFVVGSVTLELVQMNFTHQILQDKDILEGSADLLAELKRVKNRFAFTVLYGNAAALVFALPIILVRGPVFVNSVIAPGVYLSLVPFLMFTCLILYKGAYDLAKRAGWFEKDSAPPDAGAEHIAGLNRIQGGAIVFVLFFSFLGVLSSLWSSPLISYLALAGFFVALAAAVISLIVFATRTKKNKKRSLLLAAGIRNIAYGLVGVVAINGITIWIRLDGVATFGQYNMMYFYWASLIAVGATGLYYFVKVSWFKS